MTFRLTALLASLALHAAGCVDDTGSSAAALDSHGACRPPRPPREAIDACASSSAGAACSFTHDDHTIDGTCTAGPDDGAPLGCKPNQPPPPPPEALAACDGAAAGDPCDLTAPDGAAITGRCANGPAGDGPLACAPSCAP